MSLNVHFRKWNLWISERSMSWKLIHADIMRALWKIFINAHVQCYVSKKTRLCTLSKHRSLIFLTGRHQAMGQALHLSCWTNCRMWCAWCREEKQESFPCSPHPRPHPWMGSLSDLWSSKWRSHQHWWTDPHPFSHGLQYDLHEGMKHPGAWQLNSTLKLEWCPKISLQ